MDCLKRRGVQVEVEVQVQDQVQDLTFLPCPLSSRRTMSAVATDAPLRLWTWTRDGLAPVTGSWPTLDAQSLALPDGVYTTLRTYGGTRVVGLESHLRRLEESRRLLGAACSLDVAWLRAGLRAAITAAAFAEARLRITVPLACDQAWIGAEPFVPYPAWLYDDGARCATSVLARQTPRAKSTRFIAPASSARGSSEPGVHELLLVDGENRILEGSSSNFFAVLDGELRTAGEEVLAGVTRGIVLALGRSLLPVREEAITAAELAACSEAFITSSSREVMPVVDVDHRPIGDGRPGPVARELGRLYRAHLLELAEEP